ncbi:Orn/Lys/Arg decarboxylase, C-terminal domain, partial [Musa troglodytarum]
MISCLTNKLAYSSICGSPAKCSRRVAEEAPEFRELFTFQCTSHALPRGRHRKVGSGIGGGGEQTTKSMDTRAHQTKKQATAESTEDDSYGGVAPCATNAPFVSALMVFAEREPACFCFPGHNGGKAASAMLTRLSGPDVFTYDSTPLPWLGNLFSSKGPLTDAQELAAE